MTLSDMVYTGAKEFIRNRVRDIYPGDFKVLGKENIPENGPLIYSAVHLEKQKGPFLTGLAVDERVYFWANDYLFNVKEAYPHYRPFFDEQDNFSEFQKNILGMLLTLAATFVFNVSDFVPVSRESHKTSRKMIDKSLEHLLKGKRLCIFSDAGPGEEINDKGAKKYNQGTAIAAIKYLQNPDAEESIPIVLTAIHNDTCDVLFSPTYYITKEQIEGLAYKEARIKITEILEMGMNDLLEILWSDISDEEKVRQSQQIWD